MPFTFGVSFKKTMTIFYIPQSSVLYPQFEEITYKVVSNPARTDGAAGLLISVYTPNHYYPIP